VLGAPCAQGALTAAVTHAHRYLTERKLPDSSIDLLDEAASRLRMQQESKPEAIADLEREVLTRQIELEALRRESGGAAAARRRVLQAELHERQAQAESANAAWSKERNALEQRKTARQRLQQARADLAAAERDGVLSQAGELTHAVIPRLEAELAQWESAAAGLGSATMLAEEVTADHIADVVSKATGIPVSRLRLGEVSLPALKLTCLTYLLSCLPGRGEPPRPQTDLPHLLTFLLTWAR
jgi:ATP-dependent Clp protease ATP-binding subunit ClpB